MPQFEPPPRSQTSGLLWKKLLNPDLERSSQSQKDSSTLVPPVVPLDKNATSMRILLHDTQANFEKFALHVEKLLDGVSQTKSEIKTANTLFERDRESLLGDIVDLVNRSQKEIQKVVGQPAQALPLEGFFKDVLHRLDGLDHRMDALQNMSQVHCQTLQSQVQAIQVLLDKHGTIAAAVTPLLPLLQGLPLLIDSVKGNILDSLSSHTSARTPSGVPRNSPLFPPPNTGKRSLTSRNGPSPSPSSHNKRPRLQQVMPLVYTPAQTAQSTTTRIEQAETLHILPRSISQITVPTLTRTNTSRGNSMHKTPPQPGFSPQSSNYYPSSSPHRLQGETPRCPLADLPTNPLFLPSSAAKRQTPGFVLKTPAFTDSAHRSMNNPLPRFRSVSRMPDNSNMPLHGPLLVFTRSSPSAGHPPRTFHAENSVCHTLSRAGSVASATDATRDFSSRVSRSPLAALHSKVLSHNIPQMTESNNTPTTSATPPNQPSQKDAQGPSTLSHSSAAPHLRSSTMITPRVAPTVALGKIKERRSPVREGRRFIALVDSEDEADTED